MLKANSKKVLDIIAGQTKQNAKRAYMEVYPDAKPTTAEVNASNLLKKPEAQIYLQKHVDKAKKTIVTLMDSEKDDIKLRASTDVLDREYGKATQKTENTNTSVTLNLDLSSFNN